MLKQTSLDEYLETYGGLLGQRAEARLAPLHVPGRDEPELPPLLRELFPAQRHVVAGVVKALRRQKSVLVVAECGTGKTTIAAAAVHARAAGRPYRALVFCPGQLVQKWQRELEEIVPGAQVTQLETWHDVVALDPTVPATGPQWYVIARDRAKLGSKWAAAVVERRGKLYCPCCGGLLTDKDGLLLDRSELDKKRRKCEHVLAGGTLQMTDGCGAPLWQMTGELQRYEPALYIKWRLRHFFGYLILDEMHEEKGADTAQGHAAGALAAACGKVIALTGTLIGGYAEHLRPLLFRLAPTSLVGEGFEWGGSMKFSEVYGRVERRVTEKETDSDDNRQSRGTKRTQTKSVRPGIMPPLYGRHLLDKAVFLSLAEVSDQLPALVEENVPVEMDPERQMAYESIEEPLSRAIKELLVKGNKKLLGPMLNALLCYPDYPYHWEPIGYWDRSEEGSGCYVTVCIPSTFAGDISRPKEQKLIELCLKEKAAGRQVWVFAQYTDKHDVQGRLEKLLSEAGLKVGSLRAKVSLSKREEWIRKQGPKCDVVVSHPKLVETGLDLFDKGGAHNFATLIFYECGYNLFTLRQASRRAWRIGQKLPCQVYYLYYAGTMQARAMQLMGKKMMAALALEGQFSSEGLAALVDDAGSMEIALAKALEEKLEVNRWSKHEKRS